MLRATWIALCSGVLVILGVAGFVLHRRSAERAELEAAFRDHYAAFNRRDVPGALKYIREGEQRDAERDRLDLLLSQLHVRVEPQIVRVIVRGDEGQVIANMKYHITDRTGTTKQVAINEGVSEWSRVDGRWYLKRPGFLPAR